MGKIKTYLVVLSALVITAVFISCLNLIAHTHSNDKDGYLINDATVHDREVEVQSSRIKYKYSEQKKIQDSPGQKIYTDYVYMAEKVAERKKYEEEAYKYSNEETGTATPDIYENPDVFETEQYMEPDISQEAKTTEESEENSSTECISSPNVTEQSKVTNTFIIDTDFSSDVDDAFAISTAMYFQDVALMDVKGIALCCTSTRGAYAMSALLGQHGYWNIPIASDWDDGIAIGSKYHLNMSNFPHNENYYGDTVNFYRMLLSSAKEPVNIIALGQLINMADLLDSGPDTHSPLTGKELVREKVRCLYFVGGKSNGKIENNIFYGGEDTGINKYYGNNGVTDAAAKVAEEFPSPVVFMEADICGTFSVGDFLSRIDKSCNDILTRALVDYGTPDGCASFDPMGIYMAVADANGLLDDYGISKVGGTMRIFGNGTSGFTEGDTTKNHYHVNKKESDNYYKQKINNMLEFEYEKRKV